MNGKRRAAGPAQKKAPKPARTRKQKMLRAGKWVGIVGLVCTLLAVGSFVALYQAIDVPAPNEEFQDETTVVSYANGDKLGTFATQNRDIIRLEEMPETLQNAVVAAENQSFWSDRGIDPKGILRAAFSNASGGSTQGASTITQQYVKILYLNQDRSYTRKVKEAILSLKIQRQQSKKEILANYLNTIYFGRGAYGVQAAAQAYFRKPAKELNLRESVVLARVLNNPTAYDPANGDSAKAEPQGRLRLHPQGDGPPRLHHRGAADQGPAAAAEVPAGRQGGLVRRPARAHARDGQGRARPASATRRRRSSARACG